MPNPDANVPLGPVTNYEGQPEPAFRDFDGLDLTRVSVLLPKGVRELEADIAAYWQGLAAYRLRTADLSGIDMDMARSGLFALGLDPGNLEAVQWHEVGAGLGRNRLSDRAGLGPLRKLHALLTGNETKTET
jgi:hypothetical protein